MEQSNIVIWERKGEFGVISISNGKENYLNNPDFLSLDKLKQWTSEKGLKGIIIRGVGRNFSAGADIVKLDELAKNQDLMHNKMAEGKMILDYIENLNIPVIAAINGVCFGGGLEIALACHIRIASKASLFAFPETNHGFIPGLGGIYRMVQLTGNRAKEFLFNGDMYNAEKAYDIGLVDHISKEKDSLGFALTILKSITTDRSIELINSAMQAIRNATLLEKNEALKIETELFCKLAVNVKKDL